MTMKNLVPNSAHSKPKVAAICIHNFLFSGILLAKIPEISKGAPSIDGKYDVTEFDSESSETAMPQITKNAP